MDINFKNQIALIASLFPLVSFKHGKQYPRVLPFYHLVSNTKVEYINSYVVRNEKQFENELDFLLKYYKPVSLQEIIDAPAPNKMHLSFDDGLIECHSVIAPILKRKGIPATFFINPGFVENNMLFHRFKHAILTSKEVLPKAPKYNFHHTIHMEDIAKKNNINFSNYKPYMSLSQIQDLKNDGFTIGAHSVDHPEMWLLNEDEQYRQITESIQWVVKHFQPKIKAFAFPFTDDGIKFSLFERLKKDQVLDVSFGTAGLKFDQVSNHFQRIPIERADYWSIKKVMCFEYFYYKIRHLFSANTIKRN